MDVPAFIDFRTLVLLSGVFLFTSGLVLIAFQPAEGASAINRKVQMGWGVGSAASGLGIFLMALRELVPDFVSVSLGCSFVMLGVTMMAIAYSNYVGLPKLRRTSVIIGISGVLLFHIIDLSGLPLRVLLRAGLMLAVITVLEALQIAALSRIKQSDSSLRNVLIFVHGALLLPLLWRLYERTLSSQAYILDGSIGVLALFFGTLLFSFVSTPVFILMLKQDSDQQLIEQARQNAMREAELMATHRIEAERFRANQSEGVSQVARGLAHDFNNVLSVIKFGLKQLEEADLGQPETNSKRVMLDRIYRSLEHGLTSTTGLMSLGASTSVPLSRVSVAETLEELQYITDLRLHRDIERSYLYDADSPIFARTNGPLLKMALMNIVLNARDAMAGGGQLTISAQVVDWAADRALSVGSLPPGRYVQIKVTDTGSGMTQDQVENMFDADFTQTRSRTGTGLGLFMVKKFVEQTGAGLSVSTTLGTGTEIVLLLDASREETANARDQKTELLKLP